MDVAALRRALAISDGVLAIEAGRLTANLEPLWRQAYGGTPPVLTAAAPGPGDGTDGAVVVVGHSTLLGLTDLPVQLRATLDGQGDAQLLLTYSLPDGWTFGQAFADLPTVVDWGGGPGIVLLDNLGLTAAQLIVTSLSGTDGATGAPLWPGINFAGRMAPGGVLGTLRTVFGQTDPLPVFGTIVIPPDGVPAPPVPDLRYPWELTGPVPGILLQAPLTAGVTLGGSLTLGGVVLHLYSATSVAWEKANPTYTAVQGYSATLAVPSAHAALRVTAEIGVHSPALLIVADFAGPGGLGSGLTLADLADLAGAGDLLGALPEGIRMAATALLQVALTEVVVAPSLSAERFGVTLVSLAAGFPALRWPIWDGDLVVGAVMARFSVTDPFGQAAVAVDLSGIVEVEGVPLRVGCSSADGFTVSAALVGEATIPLAALLATYAPGVPAPSDLTIDALNLTVVPAASYTFALEMADEPHPWVLDVGVAELQARNLSLWLQYAGGQLAGSFAGELAIAGVTLDAAYTIPGDITVRGTFPTVRLGQIWSALAGDLPPVPSAFDLTFTDTSVVLSRTADGYGFEAGTTVQGFGILALVLRRAGTGWGFACGLDLGPGLASGLPALGPLAPLLSALDLRGLVLVISSLDDPGFAFPDMDQFESPSLSGRIQPPGATGVQQGFNLFARWATDPGDATERLLAGLLGVTAAELDVILHVSLPDPGQNSSVYASLAATLVGWRFAAQFGARLRGDSPELFVAGLLAVSIQGQPQTFYLESTLAANGVYIAGSMTGSTPVTISIDGTELFRIGNLAVAVGCDFEGIPSFGVAGTIAEGRFASSLAVFVNSVEPEKSMVAGSVSDLSLADVLDALTGGATSDLGDVLGQVAVQGTDRFTIPASLAAELDGLNLAPVAAAFAQHGVGIPSALAQAFLVVGTPGEAWFLTALNADDSVRHYGLSLEDGAITVSLEAQLYCVPETTSLGQLVFHGPQFFINGALAFFGLRAQATIAVTSGGLAIDAQMTPIVIYSRALFSLTAVTGDGGPRVSGATFTQPAQTDPALRDAHLLIDGRIEILGLERRAYVCVTSEGLAFDIGGDVSPGVRLETHGTFDGLTSMRYGGAATVGVGVIDLGPLGEVPLNTNLSATLDIGFEAPRVWTRAAFGFTLLGDGHSISADLSLTGGQLADLAGWVYEQIKAYLEGLFTDPPLWLKAIYDGVVTGVEDVVDVLVSTFGMSETEALKLFNSVWEAASRGCAATAATLALFG